MRGADPGIPGTLLARTASWLLPWRDACILPVSNLMIPMTIHQLIRPSVSVLALSVLALASVAHSGTIDPGQEAKWFKHYAKQPNIPKPGEMLINTDPEPELTEGFTELFNGKNLEGWTPKGGHLSLIHI